MKYSSGSSSTLFCEQVSTVTSLFEKWNDCERTVVIYALLKRLRYPSLKFLQHSIENNLIQNLGLQNHMTTFDINANSSLHLQNLVSTYKSFPVTEMSDMTDKESIYFGSDFFAKSDEGKMYNKKEDILHDVLGMLPLLKPGNDEAKFIYLSLIPIAVEDTARKIVSTEVVQQIFSYLLIHPAISNEDRRSLSHWLRHLEDHIQSSFSSTQNLYVHSNNTDACSSNSSTSVSSSVGSVASRNAWQAIAPPQQSMQKGQQQSQPIVPLISEKTEWNVALPNISDNLCDNFNGIEINELGSSQNSLGLSYSGKTVGAARNCSFGSNSGIGNCNVNTNNDDHHTSFSKNGTEIMDFDSSACDTCSCTHSAFPSLLSNCDHMNRWSLDGKMTCMKTRRSNSLTTAIASLTSSNTSVTTVNENCTNSSENLAQYAQKPRSFSLSIENSRKSTISTGSDTRLDEIKLNYLTFNTHNSGMSNIGQWLKSLRLHKYIDLFKNITYEAMLEITEEYLQELGVTKGASHKLALCIEKLNERCTNLAKIEEDLISGQIKLSHAIDELASIVLTPMKPADASNQNVAFKFINVLDMISCMIIQKDAFCLQDEEHVSVLLWILERTLHGEAFVAHTTKLKDLKFKLSKLKISFAPKTHHTKTGSSGNLSKSRWSCKSRKTDQKNESCDRVDRKNSNDMLSFSLSCSQQNHLVTSQRNPLTKGYSNNGGSGSQYKSSSYPNFISGGAIPSQTFHHIKSQVTQQPIFAHNKSFALPTVQQQVTHHQHMRSLNNLIVVTPGQGSSSNTNSNVCVGNSTLPPKTSLQVDDRKNRKQSITNSTSLRNQKSADLQQQQSTTNVVVQKPLEKTMAAVVLVSKQNISDVRDFSNIETNNNNVSMKTNSRLCSVGICNSSHSCSSMLSTSICPAITSNLFITPTSNVLLSKEKNRKSNNMSDIKSLEQLEFLCLQMTEQAIN